MEKQRPKREILRERLIETATRLMAEQGLQSLRARDIATQADCALGAIYTVFDDLDGLILAVNHQTLQQLNAALALALRNINAPEQQLHITAETYLHFACQHQRLWRALFEHRSADNRQLPSWQLEEQAALLGHITKPLATLQPAMDEAALMLRARSLFAAVHGIVSIGLEERFVSVPPHSLETEVHNFMTIMVSGLQANA